MAANKLPTNRTFADDAVRGRIRIAAGLALTLALVLVWRFYVLQVSEYERYPGESVFIDRKRGSLDIIQLGL